MSVANESGLTYRITASPTSTNTELQTSHSVRLRVVSDDYSSYVTAVTVDFTVTVNEPACNCALQPWDDGTGVTSTAPVGSTTNVSLPTPSVSANAYTSAPAMRSCTVGSCATTGSFTAVTLTGGTALPSWIVSDGTALAIAPTDGSVKASNDWVVIVTYTPTEGSNNPAYTAVTITVSCEVASFAISGAGTTSFTYATFGALQVIDGSTLVFTQSPACGYTFTNSWSYTIPSGDASSVVTQGGFTTPSFNIESDDTSKVGTFTLTLTNDITIDSGQGQSTTSFAGNAQSYTLTVTNPCPTTTVASITFSPSSITVTDGSTATSEFVIPTDDVDTAASPL